MIQVFLGAMGWSYNFWPIYNDTSSNEYLHRYAENFNSVEVNSTFYRIPRKSFVENWNKQTPDVFKFAVKLPQSISYTSGLNYDSEKLDVFLNHIEPFEDKLGPLLLQLSPKLTPDHSKQLDSLLSQLRDHKVAVEFRHKDWFKESTYNQLRDHNAALVYVEHPWRSSEEIETSNFIYIRLEGDRKKVNGEKGITELDRFNDNQRWAEKIHQNNKTTYLYVSKYYSGYPPSDILQIKNRLEVLKET